MKIEYNAKLKANLTKDNEEIVRQINHKDEYYLSKKNSSKNVALDYINDVRELLNINSESLKGAHQKVSFLNPLDLGENYRLSEEKRFFDSVTYGFYQTYLNVPIWRAGLSITIKENPNRVIMMTNTSHSQIDAKLPESSKIENFKGLIQKVKDSNQDNNLNENTIKLGGILKLEDQNLVANSKEKAKLIRGRFFVYKYDKESRTTKLDTLGEDHHNESFKIPHVNESIKDGNYYLVVEITFSYNLMNYLMLVDVETSSILYIEPLTSGLSGQVFIQDPITKSGVSTNTPNSNSTTLNPLRDSVTLNNLDAPIAGIQNLKGTYAEIKNVENPNIAPPTNPSGTDFNYDSRTNEFAAVNAYYHTNRFFEFVDGLGFPINTYFNNTTFPIPIDHRGLNAAINAHCVGNGINGISHCCYALADISNTSNPIGIATDWKVVIHELGGHGILYGHVGSANFGFSHSAGDSLAMIINDPDSNAPDRFLLAPFVPAVVRRSDRDVASGWGWGGIRDTGGYSSEQILSTTLFRFYLAIGGSSSSLSRREFARDVTSYLIFRTISTFTSATNPNNALQFCNAMMATDLLNWTSRSIYGGGYNKVVRWAFEKQGLFQPLGVPSPITTQGAPPAVDVYIEDGRNGEYEYQAVHWNCQSIWNRRSADGLLVHEEPKMGQNNYVYFKIKNRGTQLANNINVQAFHCLPGAGLNWPNDFNQMTYMGATVAPLAPNSSSEIVVGPFEWSPNTNAYGHDCIIAIVNATGDPSNVDNFTTGESIAEWRLVPNDNNVAQRNVNPVPAFSGIHFIEGLKGRKFWVGNTDRIEAEMSVKVELPSLLAQKNWKIGFMGINEASFYLDPNEKQEMVFDIIKGEAFTREELIESSQKEIIVSVYANEAIIGGMTYKLDPDMEKSINDIEDANNEDLKCNLEANNLLKCMNISNQDVKCVSIKKVSLDIEMEDKDCSC